MKLILVLLIFPIPILGFESCLSTSVPITQKRSAESKTDQSTSNLTPIPRANFVPTTDRKGYWDIDIVDDFTLPANKSLTFCGAGRNLSIKQDWAKIFKRGFTSVDLTRMTAEEKNLPESPKSAKWKSRLLPSQRSNGWGSTMSVVQNGIVVATLSGPTTGNATLNQNVSLCDGIQFQVIWNTGGTGTPSQVGLQIKEALAPQGIIYTLPLGSVQSNTTPLFETVAICTPPSCPRPTMLAISLTGSTTTTVGWNENGSATEWEVIYLPFGSTPPLPTALGLLTTSNPVQLSGLLPGTTYTIYVRSKCSPTNTSFWSNGITLTTTPGNDNCANALNTPVNSAAACDQTVFGTISGATASALPAIVSPCIGAPDDDIWFKFNATNSYLQITLRDVISTSTLGGNLNFAVYSGNCGALVNPPIFCSIANVLSGVVNGMTVGQTYYVRVYSNAATPQNATFNLCITTPSTCENSTVLCGTSGITYGNTTGVESLGQIGCLFTSPNPRYFKIKIINSGPVNLQISQTLTSTGLGADVDYIAWGPFTTAVNICNGISVPFTAPIASTNPLNLTGQQNPAQTGGCSYSGNPIEFWDIENAVAGQYYVLMVTNFSNNPGTVNIVQTNSTVPNAGLTVCCPNADFVYNPKEFCKTPGAPNPIPTIKAGSVAGTFTCISANASTLIFANVTTGEINLAASAPGIYTIQNATTVTVDCTDPSKYTFDITIYGAPAIPPSISYALTTSVTFCNTDTAVKPVTLLNGVPGSNFYAVPNIGLNINAITGGITPNSSTPGTYVVHYKVLGQGNCADLDSVYTVSIISPPNVIQPANAVACGTYTLTAPANGVGTYYTTSGGIGTPVATGTVFTANQTLYLYATNGACSIEKTVTITINNTPVSIASVTAQPTCTIQSGTITVTGPTSPTVTLPTKLFISEVTDSATNALTYVELYNPTAAAINLSGYKLRIHDNGNTVQNTNCNSILSGTIQPNSTFVVKFTNNADIPGIVPPPTPYSNVLCGGIDTNDNIRLTTNTNVVIDVWGLTTGIPFTPLNQAGYTYRRLSNAGPIPNPDITATGWNPNAWLALDPEDYSDVGQYTFNTTNYLYNVDNGVFQSSLVFSGLTPGPHSIRVKNVSTGCISAPVTYTVDPLPTVLPLTAFTYPVTTICKNSTTTTLTPTATTPATFIAGGTYFATGTNAANLSINATTGEINIATSLPGTYSISYTVASPTNCYAPFVTLTINPVVTPVVGFSYSNANYCKNATNPSPITVTGFSTLGTFSVTPPTTLLSINATTGVINLSASTAGTYNVVYTVLADATTCRVQQVSLPVTVTIVNIITPVTGFSYAPSYCAGSTNPLPTLVSGFTPLGSFSAPAGLTINPTTGLINIASSTAGNYIVNYKVTADAATCRSFSENNFALTISSTVSPMISGECQGTAFVLTATPLNASYISTAVTYIWKNTATNTVVGTNLPTYTATQAGNYSVTVTNSLGCTGTALYTANEISCSIPKGISVNGDGINDTWDLTSLKAKEVTIYNRYGQKVYSKTNYTKEWTGQTDAGADLPDGTYFYVIERVGLDSISGWVYVNHALR